MTHCKRGHEFTPENTLKQSNKANGTRLCRACQRERDRLYQLKRYHSTDPGTRRQITKKMAKVAFYKRAKRLEKPRSPRPPIDLAFIDRIIREELDGTV